MADKKYLRYSDGKKVRDSHGFNRFTKDGGKTVYGSNYKIGVGVKKFSGGKKSKHWG